MKPTATPPLVARAKTLQVPAVVWDFEQNKVLFVNDFAIDLFGKDGAWEKPRAWMSSPTGKLFVREATDKGIARTIDGSGIFDSERIYSVSGYTDGENRGIITMEAEQNLGQGRGADVSVLDIERARHGNTKKQLKKSEGFVRNLVDSSMNMILSFDRTFTLTDFNRTAEKVFGHKKEELVDKPVNLVFGSMGEVEKILAKVDATGFFMGEVNCVKADGNSMQTYGTFTNVHDHEDIEQGYMCSLRDMSEAKMWRTKVRITEERYRDLFENATDMIVGTDTNGKIAYANRAWYRKMGYTREDIGNIYLRDTMNPQYLKDFEVYFEELKKGISTPNRIWHMRSKQGKEIIVEANNNVKKEKERPVLVRSILRDVTQAVKTEESMKDQAAKIKAIFESGSVMLWTVNRKISLTSFNTKYGQAIKNQYGVEPVINLDLEKPRRRFASKAYHDFWEQKYKEVFKTGESMNFQTKTTDLGGKIHYRDIHLNPIRFDQTGEVKEVAGMGIDITEKRETERALSEQSRKIQTIFNSTNHMIWSVGSDFKLTFYNEAFSQKMKKRFGVEVHMGESILDIVDSFAPSRKEEWEKILRRVFAGEKIQFEDEIKDKRRVVHIEEVALSPIVNENGQIIEVTGLSQTVTFKRAAEAKLKEQASKIHAIFDSTAMLIWTVDKNYRIVAYNKVFATKHLDMLHKEVSIGSNFLEVVDKGLTPKASKNLKSIFQRVFKGHKQQFEGKIMAADGQIRWMETYLSPIFSANKMIREVSCITHEITDKKVIEEQMRESIREKEILLQEVHHRVKNNLQVISSILNLQTSFVKDRETLDVLQESQNRIKSMSFIHESLYQTKDFSGIEFSDYLLSLTKNLIHTYSFNQTKVTLRTRLDKTNISLDQAIPCGLIVNEIVSNALKYAFPDRTKGTLSLAISEKNQTISLEIADDGIGMPDIEDPDQAETLGLQLIYTLIEQLEASIKVDTERGTKYLITFEKQP